jgi:hypothetical protein
MSGRPSGPLTAGSANIKFAITAPPMHPATCTGRYAAASRQDSSGRRLRPRRWGCLPGRCRSPTARLHEAGLVDRDKRGVWVYYQVRPQALASLGTLIGCPPQ